MIRNVIGLAALALSTPLAAHEGMGLESPLHIWLHRLGSDSATALAGIALIGIAALVARRVIRRGAASARSDSAR